MCERAFTSERFSDDDTAEASARGTFPPVSTSDHLTLVRTDNEPALVWGVSSEAHR